MSKRYWNMGIVRLFNDVLYEEALSQTPNGLRYHLINICVEELAKVNKDAEFTRTLGGAKQSAWKTALRNMGYEQEG